MTGLLIALAIPYYRRVRLAVARAASDSGEEIDRLAASPVPLVILGVGLLGLGVILWLMIYKPF